MTRSSSPTGSLLSRDALAREIPEALRGRLGEADAEAARRRMQAWHVETMARMGPACGPRAVFDRVAAPVAAMLGFAVTPLPGDDPRIVAARLSAGGRTWAVMVTTGWGEAPQGAWRTAAHHGIAAGARWCFCMTGPAVRVVDAARTYSRRFLDFDLETLGADERAFAVFWGLLRAEAFAGHATEPLLDRAVALSEQHCVAVRASLQHGVEAALGQLASALAAASRRGGRQRADIGTSIVDESLVIIYRILFLLFAEARGLVPNWHPVYRDSYTIESLRRPAELGPAPRGAWETLQAIARLARQGCRAGSLHVPPFNGRLFSESEAPRAEWAMLGDAPIREVLLALTTRAGRHGRERISYADLGVEQLGGVYERVLDLSAVMPATRGAPALVRTGRRKATGAFYTPRSLTDALVRRTLAPLAERAASAQLLALRVLDPAMGSGAFLVATCRYLARMYEAALVREGVMAATDVSDADRSSFRRAIAQRCLYGVDLNPMAVQLARLSLWLATLAGDRPLTFLDHHLRTGNSIAGASLADVARQRPSGRGRLRHAALPLFEWADLDAAVSQAVPLHLAIAQDPGDTLEQVRAKERLFSSLQKDDHPVTRWKAVADLWCAAWYRQSGQGSPAATGGASFEALADELLGRPAILPSHVSRPMLERARSVAARERFFHWPLEFPEVFHDGAGHPHPDPGFDAVIGNPPWEMLRTDHGDDAVGLVDFTRASGIYRFQGSGHANLYQLFLERALSLVRRGGRIGMLVPSGLAADHGCAALRRCILDRTSIDTFISFENRGAVFPVHRSLKFLAITATTGASTPAIPCRFGMVSPDALDSIPDEGPVPGSVDLPRALIDRVSGEQAAVPELRTALDVAIVSRIVFSIPALGDPAGWNVAFGRELNATEDRHHFTTPPAATDRRLLPVLEGKQILPFAVDVAASRAGIRAGVAEQLLDAGRTYLRDRLGYRDVAASTNRLTLIAAIIPAGTVTTHTIFCLKTDLDPDAMDFLCAVFNSYVANYLVRLRVGTHVTVSIVSRLPVPKPPRQSTPFRDLASLCRLLRSNPSDGFAAATLQARVASLYGLDTTEFRHILDTFPLITAGERNRALGLLGPAVGGAGQTR